MWKSKTRCALSSRKWTNDRCKRRIRFVITHTNHSLEPTLSQTSGVRIHFIRTLVHCRVFVARSFTVMEKIPDKERKPDQRYPLAKLASPLLVVVIAGLIACVIFQFITLASTERRLKEVEKKLNEISKKRSEYTHAILWPLRKDDLRKLRKSWMKFQRNVRSTPMPVWDGQTDC